MGLLLFMFLGLACITAVGTFLLFIKSWQAKKRKLNIIFTLYLCGGIIVLAITLLCLYLVKLILDYAGIF